jgi:hypothetical protein
MPLKGHRKRASINNLEALLNNGVLSVPINSEFETGQV